MVYVYRNKSWIGGGLTPLLVLAQVPASTTEEPQEAASQSLDQQVEEVIESLERSRARILSVANGGFYRVELYPGNYQLFLMPDRDTRFFKVPDVEYHFSVEPDEAQFISILVKMKVNDQFEITVGTVEPDKALPKLKRTKQIVEKSP